VALVLGWKEKPLLLPDRDCVRDQYTCNDDMRTITTIYNEATKYERHDNEGWCKSNSSVSLVSAMAPRYTLNRYACC
jgi:hypothetical protein